MAPRTTNTNTNTNASESTPIRTTSTTTTATGSATGTGTGGYDTIPPTSLTRPNRRKKAEEEKQSWWDKYGSVELENKGSVARDHLALERTFLAWLRTSLSFASIGIAITQLFRLNTALSSHSHSSTYNPSTYNPSSPFSPSTHDDDQLAHLAHLRHLGKPLGATFLGISILILFLGFHRYFEAQHYVIRGRFPASRGSVVVVSLLAGGLIVGSLGVVLAVGPGVEN